MIEERYLLEDYLTMQEVQEAFGVTKMTVLNWKKKNNLPYFLVKAEERRIIRFCPKELVTWAKRHGKILANPHPLMEPHL